jgi:hypothetical protein
MRRVNHGDDFDPRYGGVEGAGAGAVVGVVVDVLVDAIALVVGVRVVGDVHAHTVAHRQLKEQHFWCGESTELCEEMGAAWLMPIEDALMAINCCCWSH